MADRTEGNGSHPVVVTDSTWPQLLDETVDEVARIVRTEIRLAEASLSRMVEHQTERVFGAVVLLVALVYGATFVLGSFVLLIHQWLTWWMAFGISGVVIIAAGFTFQAIMARPAAAPKRPAASWGGFDRSLSADVGIFLRLPSPPHQSAHVSSVRPTPDSGRVIPCS